MPFSLRTAIVGVSKKTLILGAVAAIAVPAAGAATYNVIDGSSIKDDTVGIAKLTPGARRVLSGADGQDGARGFKGPTGAKGATGAAGATGPAGDPGAAGAKGDTGAAGAKGDTGAAGAKGDAGTAGAKGDTGDTGDKGDTGDTGAAGIGAPMILRADATGAVQRSRNVNIVAHGGGGQYTVYAADGTNFNPCVATVDAMADGASGYGITANDTVEVHMAGPSGAPADEPFTVAVAC